jgi:hypothetical protein
MARGAVVTAVLVTAMSLFIYPDALVEGAKRRPARPARRQIDTRTGNRRAANASSLSLQLAGNAKTATMRIDVADLSCRSHRPEPIVPSSARLRPGARRPHRRADLGLGLNREGAILCNIARGAASRSMQRVP